MLKKIWLLILILISLCINPQITIIANAEDPSGGTIEGDAVVWENSWGRLEVYPHTAWEEIHQEQYCNATWKLAANDLDIAFRFVDPLIDAHIYELVGDEWIEKTDNFEHTTLGEYEYYYVTNVHFEQDETRRFKWNYDVPFNSSGKWDFMAKLSSESIQYALDNNRYVMLDPWWDSNWDYHRVCSINHDYINTDLENFTVLVNISSSVTSLCQSDGEDIRFIATSMTGTDNVTELPYEIENWDSGGYAHVWMRIRNTTILEDTDTTFLMYYGNAVASDNQHPQETWDDNYTGVWHMNSSDDSTSNNNDAIDHNGVTNVSYGIAGHAKDFEKDDAEYMNVSYDASLDTNNYTIEAWMKMETEQAPQGIVSKAPTKYNYEILMYDGYTFIGTNNDIAQTGTDTVNGTNNWYYLAGNRHMNATDTPDGLMEMYVNGTELANDASMTDGDQTAADDIWFGSRNGGSNPFDGLIDEIRISNIARNASWLSATFNTIFNSSSFISFGAEEITPTTAVIVNVTLNITATTANLTGYMSGGDYTGNYDSGFWVGQTSGLTEATKEFNFTCSGTITMDSEFNTTGTGLSSGTTYYVKSWIENATHFDNSTNERSFTTADIPDPPTNGQAVYWGGGHYLNLTWTRSSSSDKEIVVKKATGYPTTPADGTVMQNNTEIQYYNESSVYTHNYYTIWSYNDTINASSLTGLDIPWGGMGISVYNESSVNAITWDIEIKNSDGSSVYTNTSLTNPHYISTDDIPYGDDTYFRISSNYEREYNSRVYYFDTALNNFYNLSFYLCDYNDSELYRFDVTDQANQEVSECRIQVQRYIANTSQYENVSILFTDGAGYVFLFLIPETTYQITLSKDGYQTQIAEYIPFADVFTHSFVLLFEEEEFENITGDWWEDITFEGYMSSTTLTVNYTDNLDQTINVSFIVYEYNYTTTNLTAIYWWNSTDQADPTDNDFQFSTSVNSSNYHRVQMFLNHTTHGYIPHSIEFVPASQAYRDITTATRLDDLLDDLLGENPFGWGNFFAFIVLIAGLFSFGEQGVGISLMGTGFLFLFLSVVIGVFAIMVTVPVLFIVLGILVEWNIRQRRLKY